jgi:glycogen debranching enzyme
MDNLKSGTESIGKVEWRAMLRFVADLHERSVRPPQPPFPHPWEEIGPGYCYGPAFGHWDIVHAILDVLPFERDHARRQILNNLAAQQDDGLVPGVIWMRGEAPEWGTEAGHPPVWPYAVEAYADGNGLELIRQCFGPLERQIRWFETHRKAEGHGFFYTDILNHTWESGVDEGIRFLDVRTGPQACVDATAHLFALYDFAARWAELLDEDVTQFAAKAAELKTFIQHELFVEETGFFHDIWAVRDPSLRCLAFEGMWPLVVGAASPEQAYRVVQENLINPSRFFSVHPITTVSQDDPRFELRCWRGPAWNSMTYWAARGCIRYGFHEAAASLLERALDDSARQFDLTGTIWEFYHPHGGPQEDVQRKPHTEFNTPCRDYLGHNPLIAMARLYDEAKFK